VIAVAPARAALVLVLAAAVACEGRRRAPDRCAGEDRTIVVDTAEHELLLCEAGRTARTFDVALGRGGVGKRKEGDRRTPLGAYPLGEPRPSARFGTFVPIGYPTAEQAASGLTGSDVGIHGPRRTLAFLGGANVLLDWTLGCVAVGTDAEIEAIAAWVREQHAARVVLR